MKKTLAQAIAEHTAVQQQIVALNKQAVQLDKVIALLGEAEDAALTKAQAKRTAKAKAQRKGRKATAEQRQKMRDAWVRRKQKQRAAKKAAETPAADVPATDGASAELVDARG